MKLPPEVRSKLIETLSIQDLPEQDQISFLESFEEIFVKFYNLEIIDQMSEQELDQFNSLDDEQDQLKYLDSINLDYQSIGIAVGIKLNQMISKEMSYIEGFKDGSKSK